MKSIKFLFAAALVIIAAACQTKEVKYSGHPLFDDNPLTADPCALVYNDTLYLFTGSDEAEPGHEGFVMKKWYVFSTPDMVNWTNHGVKLSLDDFEWASHNAFAGHCVENNGKFWWYVPMVHKDSTTRVHEGFAMGVAVADHPLGPYKDACGKSIIADTTANSIVLNIDPAVYVDDDKQVYMFWGSWNAARYVKLKDNMVETDGPVMTVDAKNFFEAPWIHKKGDTYYLSYAAHYPSTTEYSTSKSIHGPWEYQGVINDTLPNSPTNHQAIITFKGQDYFIYHDASSKTGGPFRRSVCIDKLEYDENGQIKKVVRTSTGVPQI
ncbi:glycoside hydrolase family 43 protein [Carboxylicivirga caseinilyticus]|uniref:glycoside hydrolase family 43 protein n=1 Tax=Carboxylicivirga caseinilyticus TaxID=3417572 RepID=UPI003D3394AF|nr:glycoside hydrolase family 43 protein [Marinilabiliaceae bacterium A049]